MADPDQAEGWFSRFKDRLARSSQVFLLGVIIACGIEVLVDWNSTLFEINVLRERVRDRGMSYVSILGRSAAGPIRAGDQAGLERLTGGLFDDQEVVYVRFVDGQDAPVYEHARPDYAERFAAERGSPFADYYAKLLRRDLQGVMHDPDGERARMAQSRYRDLPQRWNDALLALQAAFSKPVPEQARATVVLFQEAVRTAEHTRDEAVTWAFGSVEDERGQLAGGVLVAFSMDRTNAAIRTKYAKGVGMVVFFVGLILAQNVLKRRDQLRLLELEARYASAKRALREALPLPLRGPLSAQAALDQAEGVVDGLLLALHPTPQGGLEALVLDPDGEGVDAAAVALHVRAAWRTRREAGLTVELLEEARALGRAALEIPLTRPLGLWLVRLGPQGELAALGGPMGGLRRLAGGASRSLASGEPVEAPAGVVGPLTALSGQLEAGEVALLVTAGLEERDPRHRVDVEAAAEFALRAGRGVEGAGDVLTWVRGRSRGLAHRDLAVLALGRG